MTCTFPFNRTLKGMEYTNGVLTIQFGKYRRSYSGVPEELAYRLGYAKTASQVMTIFANEIKGKFNVISVV